MTKGLTLPASEEIMSPSRGVYPYTLVAQLRHLQNWGGGNFRPFFEVGGKEQKSIGDWIVILGLVDRGDKLINLGTSALSIA